MSSRDDIKRIESGAVNKESFYKDMIGNLSEGKSATHFLASTRKKSP